MATKTDSETTSSPDLSALLGVSVSMEDVSPENAGQIRSSRGRQEGEDIAALRTILLDSIEKGVAKVFTGVSSKELKDTLTRKVRQAGKTAGPNGTEIKVATSYDKAAGKLFWGSKDVIDRLSGKKAA